MCIRDSEDEHIINEVPQEEEGESQDMVHSRQMANEVQEFNNEEEENPEEQEDALNEQ